MAVSRQFETTGDISRTSSRVAHSPHLFLNRHTPASRKHYAVRDIDSDTVKPDLKCLRIIITY
ncbi:uncharacterized protein PHALS_01838 [Plasmopara halstedii]|uniref:Uncharacterized protein n=1 Tax=Plasmopara halstedii TaxID=4781 RepID=A0A0P1AXM4_PLAHL|nr:uncharacterized protein PHALS_01838 [Plasmopara halstedii]CEG45549.1 hypothetical protein PHALS_01838 [Plasmopara halstedii]|eukprot:XP_024581918.1 hypothetical protein PHALS_01838 [Plasmopara halstedii]